MRDILVGGWQEPACEFDCLQVHDFALDYILVGVHA